MLLNKNTFLCTALLMGLASCQKPKPCLPPRAEISSSDQLFTGQMLNLQAAMVDGATYRWTGPNGFSSTAQNPSISNISSAASGTYVLNVKTGDCENETSKTIQVSTAASCSTVNNTINFLSAMTFSTITSGTPNGHYEIRGTGPQGDFRIEFFNDPIAKGNSVYNLTTQSTTQSSALMQIDVPGSVYANWQAASGQLYVAVNNGKITASFCSATLLNIQSTSTKTASGKIVCP